MKKPNFLIIGAMRCGTTSLYYYLSQHPEIKISDKKELHYFDEHYNDWSLEDYLENFQSDKITGEGSPLYLYHPLVPARVYNDLGKNIKFIVLLRNPVDRAYSHYWHEIYKGREKENFEKAIELEDIRIKDGKAKMYGGNWNFSASHFSYLDRGKYVYQLMRWLEFFDPENFYVVKSESFFKYSKEIVNTVFEFLNIKSNNQIDTSIMLNINQYPSMSNDMREYLEDYFAPYNKYLSEMLDFDEIW